jgi:hypothetical protein
MADAVTVAKAELYELDATGEEKPDSRVPVQFNPETLKVSFSNQIVPPDKAGTGDKTDTASTQFVGKGTTKLTVQLWFDVNAVLQEAHAGATDVRRLTKKVAYFITPQESSTDPTKKVPPAVRFRWGTFQFDGIMDSLEESLEFFSADGKPQRASLSLSLSQQEIQFAFTDPKKLKRGAAGLPGGVPGTRPLTQAAAGDTLQGLAGNQGRRDDWQDIAAANDVDNPRLLRPGQLIDMGAARSRR